MRAVRSAALLFAAFAVLAGCAKGIAGESFYDPSKYHHTPDGFRNPPGSPKSESGTFGFLRFFVRRLAQDSDDFMLPKGHVMAAEAARKELADTPQPRLTWLNHVTFLIGLDGKEILTDPFFSERASPVSFAGPKRYAPLSLDIPDLPPLNAILITHNHYDSFDLPSLRRLAARNPGTPVVVPLGLKELAEEAGFTNVRQIDWYDTVEIGSIKVTASPAIHWSRRSLWDTNQTLWCGFMIAGKQKKIWFSGDSAKGPVFAKEVAPRLGPADVAIIQIGAFLPRDFMRSRHMNPQEAVELAHIMGAKTAIASHWGALPLGTDTPAQEIAAFKAAEAPGVAKVLMRIGETRSLDDLKAGL